MKKIQTVRVMFFVLVTVFLLSNFYLGNKSVDAQESLICKSCCGPNSSVITFFDNLTATSTGAMLSPAVNIGEFSEIAIYHQVSNQTGYNITIQKSVDAVNWFNGPGFTNSNTSPFTGAINAKYYRLMVSNAVVGQTYYAKGFLSK